jgi:hypothetical protein
VLRNDEAKHARNKREGGKIKGKKEGRGNEEEKEEEEEEGEEGEEGEEEGEE